MPGRILVIDDLATNRIILKVKLSAAYYEVFQASSPEDAVQQLDETRPDLILLSMRATSSDSLSAVTAQLQRGAAGITAIPVVLLLDSDAPQDRIAALKAGACEVLSRPLDEQLLLARLRGLMRQRLQDQDLGKHLTTTASIGFAEAQRPFGLPASVALLGNDTRALCKLQKHLAPHISHDLRIVGQAELIGSGTSAPKAARVTPDLFVMSFDGTKVEEQLRLFSALRADPHACSCPILAMVPDGRAGMAPQLLDLGACDVVPARCNPAELALRITAALDRKRLRDVIRNQLADDLQAAMIDPLTGLHNRRYALSYLKCLMLEQQGGDEGFAVMVADLDHFKQVNDSYGHPAGDAVLVQVAALLKAQLRKDDLVARIGGEEFLIIVPQITRDRAHSIANALCARVRDAHMRLPGDGGVTNVTISIGLTVANPRTADADALIDQADRALYRSKAAGRNTVRMSTLNAA